MVASRSRVQCARTSPCEHAHHMARRLALLALWTCAAAALRPPSTSTDVSDSDSDSSDPFAFWDEYEESYENTPPPPPPPRPAAKPNAKVFLRGKAPKVNVTKKTTKSDEKVIKTTINIESHTNIYVTRIPPIMETFTSSYTRAPPGMYVNGNEQQLWVNGVRQGSRVSSTKKPARSRPSSTRRPRPPTTTRLRVSTKRPRTTTTRRPRPATRTARPKTKSTKVPKQKVTCSQKQPGWISGFFQDTKIKKSSKKQEKSGWFVGRFISRANTPWRFI